VRGGGQEEKFTGNRKVEVLFVNGRDGKVAMCTVMDVLLYCGVGVRTAWDGVFDFYL
jgi:hypothetical protein